MCGIAGIIKQKDRPVSEDEFFDFLEMLKKAKARGRQATGVIYVFEDGRTLCVKAPMDAEDAINYLPHREGIRALFGHTRQSTGGTPQTNENNHPHENASWALIHNGTCSSELSQSQMVLKTDCDTEEFIATFVYTEDAASKGTESFKSIIDDCVQDPNDTMLTNIVKKSFNEMSGGWSLGFVHKPTQRMFLTTQGHQPLNCMYFKDGLAFGSLGEYFEDLTISPDRPEGLVKGVKSARPVVIDWTEGDFVEKGQIFSPTKKVLFELSDQATLMDCGKYTIAEKTYTRSGNTTYYHGYAGFEDEDRRDWGTTNRPGRATPHTGESLTNVTPGAIRPASEVDPDLLTEAEWQNAYGGDDVVDKFQQCEAMRHSFSKTPPHYDVHTEDKVFNKYTKEELEMLAVDLLEDEPEVFDLTIWDGNNFAHNYEKNAWSKPPKHMMKAINKAFAIAVISSADDFISSNYYVNTPVLIWELLDDYNTLNPKMFQEFIWFERVIVAKFGLDLLGLSGGDNHDDYPEDSEDLFEMNDFDAFTTQALQTFERSDHLCGNCMMARRVIPLKDDITMHLCPRCKSKFLEDETSAVLPRRLSN